MNVRRLLPYAGFAFLAAILPALLASGDPTPDSPDEGSILQWDDVNDIWRYKWWSRATHTYFVQTSEDLQTWTWAPIVEGGEGVREYGFTTTADKFFVRLRYIDQSFADPETGDIDGDGLTNLEEVQYGLNPFSNTDDNGNGILDDWEVFHSDKFMAYPPTLFSSLLWNQTSQEEIVLYNDTDSAVNYTIEITGNEGGSYSYDDSQSGSAVYTWEDISTTGIRLATVSENDNPFEAVTLTQFVFPFYDIDYSTVYVSSNGIITFGQGSSTYSSLGSSLPINTEPAMLAVFWDYLQPHQLDDYNGLPGDIYYKEEVDRLIVQWENVVQLTDAGLTPTTFQAVLYADGMVEYRYNTIEGFAEQATVGIQDSLGATGIDFADNGIYIDSEMAVRIVPGGYFFTIDESLTGTVPAKSDATVQGTFNAKQLPFGEYTATVSISHDGAGSSPQIVSATLAIPLVYITQPEGDITILEGTGGVTFNASVQGEVDRVEYYYGSTLLGESNGPPNYRFIWAFPYTVNDPPAGEHTIIARAYATNGAIEDSLPVVLTVTPDTDLDGIPDEWEITHGFDPNDPSDATQDPDNDGFLNREEYERDLDPFVSLDTDGDGIPDGWETRPEPYAFRFYPDQDYGAYPLDSNDPDTNDEGMLDGQKDYDNDMLTIVQEIALGTNPNRMDTDGDGLHDGLEVARGSNPTVSENWVSLDTDGDGLNDLLEILFGTDPDDADTNNNGMNDREEIDNGGDAINPGPAPDPLPQPSTPAPPTPAPSPPESITPGDYDILVESVVASDAKIGFYTYEPVDPPRLYLTKKQVQTFMANDPGCVESGPVGAAGSRTHEMDPDTGIITITGDDQVAFIGDAPEGENGESVSPTRKSHGTDGMAYNDPPNLAPDCGGEWLYVETLTNEYTTDMVIANVESDLGEFTNDFGVGTPFAFRHLTDTSYAYQKVQFKFEWKEGVEGEQRFPVTHLLMFYPENDPNTPENETVDNAEVIRTISWDGISEESEVHEVDPDTEKPGQNGSYSLIPMEIAPDIVNVNNNFDEGRRDSETGYALPDAGDSDLKADRNSFHDTSISEGDVVTQDLHEGWFGALPSILPVGFADGGTITISRLEKEDIDTGRPETGKIRLHVTKDNGGTISHWPVDLETEEGDPINLVGLVYGSNATVPKEDVDYWIEGIEAGKITLEFKIETNGISAVFEQTFEVCTHQSKSEWQEQVRHEILLDTLGAIDINNYILEAHPAIDLTAYYNFRRNTDYVHAVYDHYAKIYCEEQDVYYWAGLAKLAGAPVYAGLSDAQHGRMLAPAFSLVHGTIAAIYLLTIQDVLIQANIDIFNDLAWQFAAYRSSGLCALEFVNDQDGSLLDYSAWEAIDEGFATSDSDLVKQGNQLLLQREQQDILAPTYVTLSALGLGAVDSFFSIMAENPVPGGPSFSTVVPDGSISNFTDRWLWITDSSQGMWKLWTTTSPATRKAWVEEDLRDRAYNYSELLLPIW